MHLNPQLERPWAKLERQKRAVLAELSAWSPQRVTHRPAPGGWSALDVLDHLAKVERVFIAAVRANLPQGRRVRFKHRVGAVLVQGVMLSPVRVKVPGSVVLLVSPDAADGDASAAAQRIAQRMTHWDEAREELSGLLQQLAPAQLSRGLFPHPLAGWMTVPQGLVFLSGHLRHHVYQLARLRRSSR